MGRELFHMCGKKKSVISHIYVSNESCHQVQYELPPMYFRLKEIGRFLGMEGVSALPRKSVLIQELRSRGFAAGAAQV